MRTIKDVTGWLRQYRYFHYSSYWGAWSRVIVPYNHPDGVIELNLTPVNPSWERSWQEQIMPTIFRWHCTSLDRKDKLTDVLPDYVPERMGEHLVPSFVDQLLNETWIDLIDIEITKRGRSGGGGIPFAECRKKEG
jgi:hypothetical protein